MSSAKALFPIYSKPPELDIVYNTSYSTEGLIAALVPVFSETLEAKAMKPFESGHYTLSHAQLTAMAGDVKPVQSLEAMLQSANPKYLALQNFYKVADILRSYIDMAHDFTDYFRDFSAPIRKIVETKVIAPMIDKKTYPLHVKFYKDWMERIDKKGSGIYSRDGNPTQDRCRAVMEELVDAYLLCLRNPAYVGDAVVDWIPLTKIDAHVASYPTTRENVTAVTQLRDQLRADSVNHFYVESAGSGIGKRLRDPATMKNVQITAGLWDAGSGFGTEKTTDTYLQTSALFQASPSVSASASMTSMKKVSGKEYILLASNDADGYARPASRMFGFADVKTSGDNQFLRIQSSIDGSSMEIKAVNGKPERLAVDRIAITLGRAPLRSKDAEPGDDDDEDESNGKGAILPIPYDASQTSKASAYLFLPILKTWTDPIQLRCISMFKHTQPEIKIATVIYDICCETTARMNGLGHVLLNSSKSTTYYSYDMNSRTMGIETLRQKSMVLSTVLNALGGIKPYIENWFADRIRTLATLHSYSIDPRIFLLAQRIQTRYEEQRERARELIGQLDQLRRSKTSNSQHWIMNYKNKMVTTPTNMEDWLKSVTHAEELAVALSEELNSVTQLLSARAHLSWLNSDLVKRFGNKSPQEVEIYRNYTAAQVNRVRQILRNVLGSTHTEANLLLMNAAIFCTALCDLPVPIYQEKQGGSLLDLFNRLGAVTVPDLTRIVKKLPANTVTREVLSFLGTLQKPFLVETVRGFFADRLFPASMRTLVQQSPKLTVKDKDTLIHQLEFLIFLNYLQLFLYLMSAPKHVLQESDRALWSIQPFRASQTANSLDSNVNMNAKDTVALKAATASNTHSTAPLITSWKDLYELVHSKKKYTLQMVIQGSSTPSIEAYHKEHPVSPHTVSPTTAAKLKEARENSEARAAAAKAAASQPMEIDNVADDHTPFNYSFKGLMDRVYETVSAEQQAALQSTLINIQQISVVPAEVDDEEEDEEEDEDEEEEKASSVKSTAKRTFTQKKSVSRVSNSNNNHMNVNVNTSSRKKSKPMAKATRVKASTKKLSKPKSTATGAFIGKSARKTSQSTKKLSKWSAKSTKKSTRKVPNKLNQMNE